MIQKLLLIKSIMQKNSNQLITLTIIKTKDLLLSHIGKLLWMTSQTRPDIAFDVCQLGTNFKNSG